MEFGVKLTSMQPKFPEIAPGTLCKFSTSDNMFTSKTTHDANWIYEFDDSFVQLYAPSLRAYKLEQKAWTPESSLASMQSVESTNFPVSATFLYVKRLPRQEDAIFGDERLFDNPFDGGHIILHDEQLLYIPDVNLEIIKTVIVSHEHFAHKEQDT
jgi:hypothetical protein